MTNPRLNPMKDDARAILEAAIIKEWSKTGPMFCTCVLMRDSTTGSLKINSRIECGGHSTLDEAIICMEEARPNLIKQLERERADMVILARELGRRLGVPFDEAVDMQTYHICITKTDYNIVEFASG